jgi:4-carboxymuconolactone decarboxylase
MTSELYAIGEKIRREVNGDATVDRILEDADEFCQPFQDLVTEYCWGVIWSRPDLDRRSRSILNIGMLAALNRPVELAGHIKGGLVNGMSRAEIREVLLQAAVYAGMPAGLSSFKIARKVFAELDAVSRFGRTGRRSPSPGRSRRDSGFHRTRAHGGVEPGRDGATT